MITRLKFNNSIAFIALICLSLSMLLSGCQNEVSKEPEKLTEEEPEISQTELDIDKAIEEGYKVWFVKNGDTPDFSKYDDYNTSTAMFQEYETDSIVVATLSDQVEGFKGAFEAGHLTSFDEREIGSETTYFGNVAHRISYHTYRTNSTDSITGRGVNSIQLVKINGKWKIQSILRQVESNNYRLPAKYDSLR